MERAGCPNTDGNRDKRLGLLLTTGENLAVVRVVRYWLGDCLGGIYVTVGLDSVIWDSKGQEETMSSGTVCELSSLVLNGPAPEASETSEKIPTTRAMFWPCTPL